jgi:hypothetical protein
VHPPTRRFFENGVVSTANEKIRRCLDAAGVNDGDSVKISNCDDGEYSVLCFFFDCSEVDVGHVI